MCIEQNTTVPTTIYCNDYLNLNDSAISESFKRIETSKLHLSIPNSTIYNNTRYGDFPPYVMGEVLNNFTYPVEKCSCIRQDLRY